MSVADEILINELRGAIEKASGIQIKDTSSCRKLEIWLSNRNSFVSYSTLIRFFGLSKKSYVTHNSTIDLLCRSVGFDSYKTFIDSLTKAREREQEILLDKISLNRYFLQNKPLKAVDLYISKSSSLPERYLRLAPYLSQKLMKKDRKYINAIRSLSESHIGRKNFFLLFIDEDDITRMYEYSLRKFLINDFDNDSDRAFGELYVMRKEILRNPYLKRNIYPELSTYLLKKDAHIYSRAIEFKLLSLNRTGAKQAGIFANDTTPEVIDRLNSLNDSYQILAIAGRWARALQFTRAELSPQLQEEWLMKCILALKLDRSDLEFQAPLLAYVNRFNPNLLKQPLSPLGHWPNANFNSALFLGLISGQSIDYKFYSETVGLNPFYLKNLL